MLDAETLMQRALLEARKGTRKVRPNPKVGCVFELSNNNIIEGHHEYWGGPHAERVVIEKIHKANLDAKGARVAVALEPCSHTGKTPPCVDALIAEKVKEVIFPFCDPNPLVAGQSLKRLKAAGIAVQTGVCKSEAYQINREWLWAKVLKRPFVSLKIATAKNSTGVAVGRKWITSSQARQHAMALRARVDVLITSGATVRSDDPALTVRDEQDRLALEQARVIVFSQSKDIGRASKILQHPHWEWHASTDLQVSLESMAAEGIFDVMVECGPDLASKFLEAGLVDEVWHYEAQLALDGKPYDLTKLKDFSLEEKVQIDDENIFYRYLSKERSETEFFKHQAALI